MKRILSCLLFFAILLMSACETVPKRSGATKLNSKKAKETAEAEKEDRPEVALEEPIQILRVNPDYGWVVARSGQTLPEGMELETWHGDEKTAKLVVAERSRHPHYILEVTHGDPHPRDVLVIAGAENALMLQNPAAVPNAPKGPRSTGEGLFKNAAPPSSSPPSFSSPSGSSLPAGSSLPVGSSLPAPPSSPEPSEIDKLPPPIYLPADPYVGGRETAAP